MIITYLGNFAQTFCTESHISKTLENMGHIVNRLQENDMTSVKEVANIANQSDMFLWTSTPDWLNIDGWEMIESIKVPKVSYHLDLYCSISRENWLEEKPFFHTDYVFQPDGDPVSMRKFKKNKVNAYWFPPAVFEPECYLQTPATSSINKDVAFIGSYANYHIEWMYRQKLITWLQQTYGDRFALYPNETYSSVFDNFLNKVCASTKIMIADSLCLNFTHKNYWSNRIPEQTGRGGFVIAPRISGLEKFYTDREHLVMYDFGNFAQLKELIDYYIENDEERERIRIAGYNHTKKYHTFNQRMEEMFRIIKL